MVVGHLLTSYQIVVGCREYLTGLVRATPKVDAIGKRVDFAGVEAAVIPDAPSHFGPALMTATLSAFVAEGPLPSHRI